MAEPEVGQDEVPHRVQEDVLGFKVTVHNAIVVELLQCNDLEGCQPEHCAWERYPIASKMDVRAGRCGYGSRFRSTAPRLAFPL